MYDSFYDQDLNYILVLGPPGCGKTTVWKFIAENYNYILIDYNVVT